MYIPPRFAEARPEVLHRIIREHPLGILITHGESGSDANHLPFELNPAEGPLGTLRAHVARANPVWQQCASGTSVLVIFRGAESYISPNWYPSKFETHRQVPTWNYEVVHAHGTITIHDDEKYVRGVVARLTRSHEAGEPMPWKMGDSSPEFINDELRHIVGIEIRINSIVGKVKLSQNREKRDRINAAEVLESRGRGDIARAMRNAD